MNCSVELYFVECENMAKVKKRKAMEAYRVLRRRGSHIF
jgi:hypothetical protein